MQFQKSIDLVYAIRILHYLHTYKDNMPTAQVISEAVCMADSQFNKIVGRLKEEGLITSVQGEGAYRLTKSAHEISVYDVFSIIEGELRLNHCLQEDGLSQSCGVQDYFGNLQDALVDVLSKKYIANIDMGWQKRAGA